MRWMRRVAQGSKYSVTESVLTLIDSGGNTV